MAQNRRQSNMERPTITNNATFIPEIGGEIEVANYIEGPRVLQPATREFAGFKDGAVQCTFNWKYYRKIGDTQWLRAPK